MALLRFESRTFRTTAKCYISQALHPLSFFFFLSSKTLEPYMDLGFIHKSPPFISPYHQRFPDPDSHLSQIYLHFLQELSSQNYFPPQSSVCIYSRKFHLVCLSPFILGTRSNQLIRLELKILLRLLLLTRIYLAVMSHPPDFSIYYEAINFTYCLPFKNIYCRNICSRKGRRFRSTKAPKSIYISKSQIQKKAQ